MPDFKAEYAAPAGKPPYITTYARGHENRVQKTVALYDGLGRVRQDQQEATGGGRLITDTLYNNSGEVWQTNNAYFTEGTPNGELFTPLADTAVPNATRYTYDGLGRMTSATDPNSGTSRLTYDHRDRTLTATNARNITVWNGYDELSRPTQQRLGGSTGTLLAEYSYDTAPGGKGLPASSTRYTDGLPYAMTVGGYTEDYQPTSTTLTLPPSIASTWGLQSSYTYGYTYTDTGLPESTTLPAVGKLAAEKLLVRYTKDGLPLSVSGKDWYGSETVYSPYGQLLRSTLGAHPYRVWAQTSYDEASGVTAPSWSTRTWPATPPRTPPPSTATARPTAAGPAP